VSIVGRIYDIIHSKFCHLRHYCHKVWPVCLFLQIVGSLHLKMLAMEQHASIKFCVLLYKSPLQTSQMLQKAYNMAEMKTM
jgi:hypothetical protein